MVPRNTSLLCLTASDLRAQGAFHDSVRFYVRIVHHQSVDRFILAGAPWCGAARLPAEASASPAPPKV